MSSADSSAGERSRIVVVGSYVQDHVWLTDRFPQVGETRRALGFSTGPGGKGFNQAVACVRQGGNVIFIGAIGDDALGMAARGYAERERLECRWLVRSDMPTAAAGIIVDSNGANQIMVNLAANEHLTPDFLHAESQRFADAKILLVQLESNIDAVRTALEIGRQHGLLCVLNPAPVHRDVDAALLSTCDLITPNETEFALLLEQIVGEQVAADTLASLTDHELHARCRRLGVATVIVTLGSAGCFVSHGDDERRGDSASHYRVAAENVQAIDTTGAGDAFNGALVASLMRYAARPFRDAVVHANRVAALSTEKVGAALATPSFDDVIGRFGEP